MREENQMEMLKQIAAGLASQFGPNCEVVVHDLEDSDCTIAYIENGHVSGRKVGDGPSKVVAEQLFHSGEVPQDHLAYLTRTPDGKILKSSTLYIRDSGGKVSAILSINYDISALLMIENALSGLLSTADGSAPAERISVLNVNDLLDDLIEQSVALTGKPVALMTKDDKVRAIQFLSRHGAFLITKSGDKVAKYFGISKYTLYSYIDTKLQEEKRHEQD
ncbi:MAG: helix-turn-helix transcriptional regulator [Oscillospiraceae bacterium]|nr:helix-turn-helix transcriptional regulator [Oscillospiraceae bacterium]